VQTNKDLTLISPPGLKGHELFPRHFLSDWRLYLIQRLVCTKAPFIYFAAHLCRHFMPFEPFYNLFESESSVQQNKIYFYPLSQTCASVISFCLPFYPLPSVSPLTSRQTLDVAPLVIFCRAPDRRPFSGFFTLLGCSPNGPYFDNSVGIQRDFSSVEWTPSTLFGCPPLTHEHSALKKGW